MKIAKYLVLVGTIVALMSSIVFGGQIVVKTGGTAVGTFSTSVANNKEPINMKQYNNGTTTAAISKDINQFTIDDTLFIKEITTGLSSSSSEITEGCLKFKWNTATPALEIYYQNATGTVYLMSVTAVAK